MTMRHGGHVPVATSPNLLLSGLSGSDSALLRPHVESVQTPRGTRLLHPSRPIDAVYFPEAGLYAVEEDVAGRLPVEVAVIGREGLVGWPALLGRASSPHGVVTRAKDGIAMRIALAPLQSACAASSTLLAGLLGFVQEVMAQMIRTIVAHGESSFEQRLARWLLMRHDRVDGDPILVCHSEIADALNVRRASVTDHLHILEGERLIQCRRGRVIVRDRMSLEDCAGTAYGEAEARSCSGLRNPDRHRAPGLVAA